MGTLTVKKMFKIFILNYSSLYLTIHSSNIFFQNMFDNESITYKFLLNIKDGDSVRVSRNATWDEAEVIKVEHNDITVKFNGK